MAGQEASRTPSQQHSTRPEPGPADRLRTRFDSLPFPERAGALARYARTLTPDAYSALHHTLDAGEPDERHTALFLAVARRDLDTVSRALTDALLRRRALSAAIRLPVPGPALEEVASSLIPAIRHDTYRVLRLSRRTALADRLLPEIHERYGSHDAARLLPACSAATAGAWLPRLDPPVSVLNTLARTAPTAVARLLADRYTACPARDRYRFNRRHRALAETAARRDPDAALLLLEHAPGLLTERAALSALRRPERALAVLTAAPPADDGSRPRLRIPPGPLPPAVRRALTRLPADDLRALAAYCPATGVRHGAPPRHEVAPDGLLLMLPPGDRRSIVEKRTAGRRAARGASVTALAALDPADRAELVAPWVQRWSRQAWTIGRLAVALPLEHGEPVLRALAEQHRSHFRAQAWPALLACAELEGDPQQFARIAQDCERAWHDQEGVRRPTLQQLAGAAPHLLAALPARVLRDITRTTVQSRDTTAPTLAAAEQLLRRIVESALARDDPGRVGLAAELLCDVVSMSRGTEPVVALRLTADAARQLWAATSPGTRSRADHCLALAELLVDHLGVLPGLDAAVRHLAVTNEDPELASRAAAAWVAPPTQREQRCVELVELDPSFAQVPLILQTLATRRTDLLDRVCGAAEEYATGRLCPAAGPWVLHVRPGSTGRWLPRQRCRWVALHARVAADEGAALRARAVAARALGDPEALTRLAQEAPQPVAAAALGALGALPPSGAPDTSPEQFDLLLHEAAGGGVRGRAAMASVRRLLAGLPMADAVRLLSPVACARDAPVGTRKEAVRALAAIPGPEAFEALLLAWDLPEQHRDVRAVLARALVRAVAQPRVADRLAAHADEPAVRDAVVVPRSGDAPPTVVAPYAGLLARLVAEGSDDTAVAASRVLPTWLTADTDNAIGALTDTVAAADRSCRVWQAAARQLAWLPPGPGTENRLTSLFGTLGERAEDHDRTLRRDALRRLQGCVADLDLRRGGPVAVFAADQLAPRLERAGLHADAAALTLTIALDDLRRGVHRPALWESLLRQVGDHPGRLPRGRDAYYGLELRSSRARAALLDAVRLLTGIGTAVSGSLALMLVRAGGRASSWEEPWPTELAALQEHDDPDTAMEAFLTDTC